MWSSSLEYYSQLKSITAFLVLLTCVTNLSRFNDCKFKLMQGNHAKWRCNWSATNQLLKTDHLGNGWFQSVQGIVTKHGQCVFVEMEPSTQTVPLQSTVAFRQCKFRECKLESYPLSLFLLSVVH